MSIKDLVEEALENGPAGKVVDGLDSVKNTIEDAISSIPGLGDAINALGDAVNNNAGVLDEATQLQILSDKLYLNDGKVDSEMAYALKDLGVDPNEFLASNGFPSGPPVGSGKSSGGRGR